TVHGWDKSEVMYTATKRAGDEEQLRGISIQTEQQGATLSIVAHSVCIEIPLSCSSSPARDRKSTRLNSSHQIIWYAVFCLKKKTQDSAVLNPHTWLALNAKLRPNHS